MLGERPITLADSVPYVSHQDPAVDWGRIIDRELERFPELTGKVKARLEQARLTDPETQEETVRANVAEESWGARVGEMALRHPGVMLDELLPQDGKRLTVFHLGVIPPAELARINDDALAFTQRVRQQELYWRCFLAGLRRIENWGSPGSIPTRKVGEYDYVEPEWLRDHFIRGRRAVALEVGRVVWHWNQFTEDDAKK